MLVSRRKRKRRKRVQVPEETHFLNWRVLLSRAATWERLLNRDKLPYKRWRMLAEFYHDDDPTQLAEERVAATMRQANFIALEYGPIPHRHWTAARRWRAVLAPFVLIHRGDGTT